MADYEEKIKNFQVELNKIQSELDELARQINVEKQVTSQTTEENILPPQDVIPQKPIQVEIPKPWQQDKNIKFTDGTNGRVTLAFPRIMALLDNNIKQNNTSKPWSEIKTQLLNASSVADVQNIIKQYNIRFSSNSIGGTRKRRHTGKRKRTSKRH
jgi:hypothetical protein